MTNPTSSCPAHLPVCLIFRNDRNLRLSSQHLPIHWHTLSSLVVHPEKSQCGNGTKLNIKLGQLYLNMYPTCSHIPVVMVIYYYYYYEPEPKYSGCKQPTFPSCFCGPMNTFLQEVAVKCLPFLSGLEYDYTHLARRRSFTGGKYYPMMQICSAFNIGPREAEDIYEENRNDTDLD